VAGPARVTESAAAALARRTASAGCSPAASEAIRTPLWASPAPEPAEELYRKALSVAQEQEAKLWELRAAASLARLWRDQGRCGAARDLLAPVYGWFTEGFATPDLKAAKMLLDELDA
jgi:hypothetical protein